MSSFTTSQRDASRTCSIKRTLLRITATSMMAASAAALIAAGGAAAKPVGTPASDIGKPTKPVGHLKGVTAVSRTLQQIQQFQAEHPSLGLHQAAHKPLIPMGEKAYQEAKRLAASATPGVKPTINARPPAANAPHVIVNGTNHGPAQSDPGNGFYPPDSNGAVSGSQIVAPVNLTYNVYARNSSPPFNKVLNVSFGALLGTTNALSDPRVIFDPIWQRWVTTLIDVTASASDNTCFWMVISKGPNAAGPFWIYHPCIGGGNFTGGLWDYDMQGMSQDAVFLTGNLFGPAPGFSNYYGAVGVSVPKAALYNGRGFSVPVFGTPASAGTLTPPIIGDSNANAFFIARDSDGAHLDLYKGTNLSNEHQFSFGLQAQIAASDAVPPNARQPGTSAVLDSLDGRFQAPSAQWGTSLWSTHAVALGSFPAPKFYQLDTSGNTIVQSGYYYESGSSDDWNPSIAVNGEGDALVSWSSTDATNGNPNVQHYPRVRFSGRLAADDAGVIGAGASLYNSPVALTGNTQNGIQRWGDYSSAFIDPYSPECRAGIFNEGVLDANTWQVHYGIVGYC